MPPRPQVEPTDDWRQIELFARVPGQRTDELIRPVVLFGQSPAERAIETGVAIRTVYRQVARFDQLGMASLVPPKMEKHRTLPPEVRQAILDAKREHPPLRVQELTTICRARFGHHPSSHTVKRLLAEDPPPPRTHRRFPPHHAIADPTQRRLAIVRLHVEGWNATSIAAYLETSRQTVHATLKRWAAEQFAGMPDKSRAPHRRGTKVTLRATATVKELRENPLLGEFRIHAALKRLGIFLSPRTCGRILALNRKLYGLPKPERVPRETKPMPFKAVRRHQFWSADIRYLDHGLGEFKVYSITVLDNYSRAIVASGLSRTQDRGAFLEELHRIFSSTRFGRVLDRAGYARFRRPRPTNAFQLPCSRWRRLAPKPSRTCRTPCHGMGAQTSSIGARRRGLLCLPPTHADTSPATGTRHGCQPVGSRCRPSASARSAVEDELREGRGQRLRQVKPAEQLLGLLPEPDVERVLRGGDPLERARQVVRLQVDDVEVTLRRVLQVGALDGDPQPTAGGLVLGAPRPLQLGAPAAPVLGLAGRQGEGKGQRSHRGYLLVSVRERPGRSVPP